MKQQFRPLIYFAVIIILLVSFMVSCRDEGDPENTDPGKDTEPGNEMIVKGVGDVRYSPSKYNMWDSWCVEKDGTVHLIHLKYLVGGLAYDEEAESVRGFGHATSTDLVHWNEQKDILKAGDSKNDWDHDYRYTGCSVIGDDGRCYVFYTMRKYGTQKIGVAWSDDMENWIENPGNPILVPDRKWFISCEADGFTPTNRSWWAVDCRDFLVIRNPEGGWLGYFVASANSDYTTPTAVVGVAKSADLLNWEQLGVVYRPTGVSMPEMIDVFEIDGKWYMTLTTGRNNGGIAMFSDPFISRAQIYAVSDSPTGMFTENPEDNVLFGGTYNSGYSSRTIEFGGRRRVLYTDSNNGNSVISLPKDVGVTPDGRLRAYYSEDLLGFIKMSDLSLDVIGQPTTSFAWKTYGGKWRVTDGGMKISCDENSWQSAVFSGKTRNFELDFTVTKDSSCTQFGAVITDEDSPERLSDLRTFIVFDRANGMIYLSDSTWEMNSPRKYVFEDSEEYRVRVLLIGNTLEIYVNDEFVFNSGIKNTGGNHAGIFANNGTFEAVGLKYTKIEN